MDPKSKGRRMRRYLKKDRKPDVNEIVLLDERCTLKKGNSVGNHKFCNSCNRRNKNMLDRRVCLTRKPCEFWNRSRVSVQSHRSHRSRRFLTRDVPVVLPKWTPSSVTRNTIRTIVMRAFFS